MPQDHCANDVPACGGALRHYPMRASLSLTGGPLASRDPGHTREGPLATHLMHAR
jgi:hypothetical protein